MPESKKKMGRPRVDSTSINLRLAPEILAWVDEERAKYEPEPSRPEFIRRVLEERRG